MDAAAFAAMSDPDRNAQFRRRWSKPAPIQRTAVLIPAPQDELGAIGYALLEAARRAREWQKRLPGEDGQ